MQTVTRTIFAVALLAGLPTAAHAQWYVGADGGVNFLQDSHLSGQDSDGEGFTDKSGNKVGYALLMQGGYDFGGPKAELEVGYRSSGLKSLAEYDGNAVSGQSSSLSFMANGIYQFLPQSSWHPFLGAGIGLARTSINWKGDEGSLVKDSDWQFAYQGIAGIAYDISKNWGVKAQYRYFATLDPKYKDSDGGTVEADYRSHAILAGLTYRFDK